MTVSQSNLPDYETILNNSSAGAYGPAYGMVLRNVQNMARNSTEEEITGYLDVYKRQTLGEAGKDETNDGLKELGSPLRLNPDRNVITPEELAETRVGETPAEANGWGILDHGVGSLEKVHVVNGRTVDVDMGHEAAYVYIAGRKYRLRSDVLTEED